MNSAKLSRSNRLKRVFNLLKKGGEYSTRDIIVKADVCAVNAIISELRDNKININCRRHNGYYYYSLISHELD